MGKEVQEGEDECNFFLKKELGIWIDTQLQM